MGNNHGLIVNPENWDLKPYSSRLYKYLMHVDAADMFERGRIRLGTLYDYRDVGRFGQQIGDEDEGRAIIYDETPHIISGVNEPTSGPYRVLMGPQPSNMEFLDCAFHVPVQAENHWIYCVSTRLSAELMAEFGRECCAEIFDPQGLFRVILKALGERGVSDVMTVGTCIYGRRMHDHNDRSDIAYPEFEKAEKHRHQAEVRGLYRARPSHIEPVFVRIPRIARFCRLLEAVPSDSGDAARIAVDEPLGLVTDHPCPEPPDQR